MSSVQSLTIPANETLSAVWRSASRLLAYGQFWQALLIGVGSLSNLVYTCTLPFICLGVIAGTTLPRPMPLSFWALLKSNDFSTRESAFEMARSLPNQQRQFLH